MFFYSEAKFWLRDYEEAEKGYKIVKYFFPSSSEARISDKRLKEIEQKRQ
jgi:hypothetical protein